ASTPESTCARWSDCRKVCFHKSDHISLSRSVFLPFRSISYNLFGLGCRSVYISPDIKLRLEIFESERDGRSLEIWDESCSGERERRRFATLKSQNNSDESA